MRGTPADARDEYLALLADGLPVPRDVARGAAAYYQELCQRARNRLPKSGMPWELAVAAREHSRLLRAGKPVPQWIRYGVQQYHLRRKPRTPKDVPEELREELREAERTYRRMASKGPLAELRAAWAMCRRLARP